MALTQSSIVLAVELDSGPVFFGTKYAKYGTDVVHSAIIDEPSISSDSVSVSLIADALPPECDGAWWEGRDSALIEVHPGSGSVYDGNILFTGEVQSQPSKSGNVISFSLVQKIAKIVELPGLPPIDTVKYPNANPDDVGKVPPLVFGTVEGCKLLAVEEPVSTTLYNSVSPGAIVLELDDVSGFPAYGAVWVDDEAIFYNGISGNQLVGLTVRELHKSGAPVVLSGPAKYMAAEHSVGIADVTAGGQPISGYDIEGNILSFSRRPLYEAVGQAMNVLVQFDQVATGSWSVDYDIAYGAGKAIKADRLTATLVTTTETSVVTPAPAKANSAKLIGEGTITNVSFQYIQQGGWATVNATESAVWDLTVSASGSVSTPSGSSVTVNSPEAFYGVTVGGKPLTYGKITLSGGNISLSGSYSLRFVFRYSSYTPISFIGRDTQSVVAKINSILKTGRTLSECAALARQAGGNYDDPIRAIANTTGPRLSVSWRETSGGAPLSVQTPANKVDVSRETESVPTLENLNQIITPPSSVTNGTYTFSVEVAPQLRQDLTNPASDVYTATLGGVSFSLPKAGGIVSVNVPVTAGTPINLVHNVIHPASAESMKPIIVAMYNGGIEDPDDLSIASALSLICPTIRRVSVTWANASISQPAINQVNAIRAITATVSQNATSFDSSISSTGKGNIRFARPNADRIVSGTYTVSYSINRGSYLGPMGIKIGDEWVYYAEDEVPAYAWNPATISFDGDTDLLPVEVVGPVTVTITAASRVVLTGNLDGGKYATLKHPSNVNFKAVQTDVVKRLGKFQKARLAVEWFMGGNKGAANPDVQVRFGGVLRGSLRLETPAGGTTSRTITVDVTNQGAATLTSSNISTVVSGGTAALSHSAIAQKQTMQAALSYPFNVGGMLVRRGFTRVPALTGWNSSLGSITVRFSVQDIGSMGNPGSSSDLFKTMKLRRANGTDIVGMSTGGGSWTQVATDVWERIAVISEAPDSVFWEELTAGAGYSLLSVTLEYNAKITSGAASVSNTPASGSTTIPNGTLNHSGTAVSVSNGSFTITVPDAPRTVVTEFELPDVADWDDLTGKVCEINYTGGVSTLDIHLVQVQIAVDYTEYNKKAVGSDLPLTATLVGLSDNPADVIQYLGEIQGKLFSQIHLSMLRNWFDKKGYIFGRRISEVTDALTLMTFAIDQSNVHPAILWDGTLAPVRWFDLSSDVIEIHERDLMNLAGIGWADRVENFVTVNYRQGEDGSEMSLIANKSNNRYCAEGVFSTNKETKISIDAFWIRDDTTAQIFLDEYVRRYARPRRMLSLSLPFTFMESVSDGSLIRFYPYNAAEDQGIFARVVRASSESGWPVIEAEEILTN